MGRQRMPKVPHGSRSRYERELKPAPLPKSERVREIPDEYEVVRFELPRPQLRDYQRAAMEMFDELETYKSYKMYEGTRTGRLERTPPKPKRAPVFVEEGDVVEAVRDGGRDDKGMPKDVPIKGERYRVVRFYIASYGVGVVLANMDDSIMDCYPYKGYVYVRMEPVDMPGFNLTDNKFYFNKVE